MAQDSHDHAETPPRRDRLPHRLPVMLRLAAAALAWERLWPALWPAAGVLGLFAALALLDVLPALAGWLHGALLLLFAVAFPALLARGLRRLSWPDRTAARRRLERDSGLAHRPLEGLEDTLATGRADRQAVALWALHRHRLAALLRRLRVRPPRAGLATADPLALRAALVLLLVVATVAGGAEWQSRVARAVTPDLALFAPAPPASVNVWINPPAYTGVPPLFLEAAPAEGPATALSVPAGSTVLSQIQGGRGVPSLTVAGETTPFETIGPDSYKLEREIHAGESLVVAQDSKELATWPFELVADAVPRIEFLRAPARSERAALQLDYLAEDDYGLSGVTAIIRRIDRPEDPALELPLPLPGTALRRAESTSYHDLTPHPWAGIAVEIQLVAEDAAGQRGESDVVRSVLPERIFNHPVARALVELRKQLTLNPDARLPVVHALEEIYDRPQHYFDDVVVALALRAAERRLVHDSSSEAVPAVQQLLWDTALHIEEGELALAERDLREIQKQLMEALAQGADDAEIERLMDQLQQALDRFLEALAEQMRDQLARGELGEPPPGTEFLQSQDLQEMIDRARDLARTGARDAARDLLAQLQNLLENLRANPFAQGMDDASRNAFRMMQDMDSLMQRQQELLDRSFRQSQRPQPNGDESLSGQGDPSGDAQRQEDLRRDLGEMMRRLGEALGDIPRALGRAERAMRDARDALEAHRYGDAVDPQARALDQLQQGMQSMAERFMEQMMGEQGPRGTGQVGAQPGRGRDPLGRQPGDTGVEALEGVEIPDEMELRRAREILDELRRRRGERQRPDFELDYIDRLLKQF